MRCMGLRREMDRRKSRRAPLRPRRDRVRLYTSKTGNEKPSGP